jgi:hypothetical protein
MFHRILGIGKPRITPYYSLAPTAFTDIILRVPRGYVVFVVFKYGGKGGADICIPFPDLTIPILMGFPEGCAVISEVLLPVQH